MATDYACDLSTLRSSCTSAMSIMGGVTPDVITRGKAAGGPTSRLSVADTAWLWCARPPGVSAQRLRHLPD
eukprot:4218691-Pleurochrysis_carterae.AAC.1